MSRQGARCVILVRREHIALAIQIYGNVFLIHIRRKLDKQIHQRAYSARLVRILIFLALSKCHIVVNAMQGRIARAMPPKYKHVHRV